MSENSKKPEVKKERAAAALTYERSKQKAPTVVAKGSGLMAEKIIEVAREHGIPLREDPALVQVLMTLDINQEIPPEVYHVVADILAMIYRAHQKYDS
ncbi:MAG: EscU/YscU/HrcU family type III secretion system export apparatus switch protein [Deltaproteobacteria bacterium]|nr:EscU/YscU/HrcU family type III secretion system export apparatus switch protein [Candidatus Anaeroferrophillus wilburensis]MBN2888933.1 EscU/YscU/HrcU family type III secretion system export apparatus switch protein [Deltaproteobacteria bacterium]